nr:disease resistance protein TAO1-like [Ipomoea batatas]
MEEVGKKESRVQIHEIIEDSPSPEEQQFPGQDETVSAVVAMKPRIDENTSSEQIQKLLDETTRLVAEGSKLKRSILEFLDVALLRSKEAATTPELSALLNMLKVQSKGGYVTALEMTQCLLEALKNYEVELTIKKVVDVSSDDSQPTKKSNNNEGRLPEKFKGIDYDKVVELFFTPKKFEGLVVVKLGEAIEVTGTGMYSLKPGEMIQDDVINSYEFILRERAGSEPKCCLADLSHRRRVCSGVVQETADQPSTVVDVSPAVASAQPRRRFPSPSRLLPGTVASQPSLLPRKKVDTDLQLRSLARLNGEAVTPTGSGSVYSLFSALMGGVVGVVVWFR